MQLVGCRTNVRGQYGGESAKPADGGHQRVILSKVFGQQYGQRIVWHPEYNGHGYG